MTDEERIERELAAVIALMRQRWPTAVDYNVRDADGNADILDEQENVLATISADELTVFWNTIES